MRHIPTITQAMFDRGQRCTDGGSASIALANHGRTDIAPDVGSGHRGRGQQADDDFALGHPEDLDVLERKRDIPIHQLVRRHEGGLCERIEVVSMGRPTGGLAFTPGTTPTGRKYNGDLETPLIEAVGSSQHLQHERRAMSSVRGGGLIGR